MTYAELKPVPRDYIDQIPAENKSRQPGGHEAFDLLDIPLTPIGFEPHDVRGGDCGFQNQGLYDPGLFQQAQFFRREA